MFGVEPDVWQAEALTQANQHGRVVVRSGHGVGKTTVEAWLIIIFGLTRYDAKIGVTAPASPQIDANLWPELRKWRGIMTVRGGVSAYFATRFNIIDGEVNFANGNLCIARTARPDTPEALQGLHATNVLVIVDEASGVDEPIWESIEGNLSTPNSILFAAGNPTRLSGYFHRAFHGNRAMHHCIRISSTDVSPDRVDRKYIDNIAAQYGVDSNQYRVRVLGEFPSEEDDAIMSLSLIEGAVGRRVEPVRSAIIWGVDVAWMGDDRSTLAKRQGNVLLEAVKWWRNMDPMAVAGLVIHEWRTTPGPMRPHWIVVDMIGIGAGVVARLQEQGYPVIGINVAERPASREKYARLRDELWFTGREWFETRAVAMPDDRELIGELTLPKYRVLSTGKMQAESKADTKKRTGHSSPDLADAFLLTFAVSDMIPMRDDMVEPPEWVDS